MLNYYSSGAVLEKMVPIDETFLGNSSFHLGRVIPNAVDLLYLICSDRKSRFVLAETHINGAQMKERELSHVSI